MTKVNSRGGNELANMVGLGIRISPHVEKRMEERNFTEIDLRDMMQRAHTFGLDEIEGRYII